MTLSGWTRLWIVAAALVGAGCSAASGDEAMTMANSAISHAQSLQSDLREASNRIDELENQVGELADARQDLENRVLDLEVELERVARQASNAEGMALSRR